MRDKIKNAKKQLKEVKGGINLNPQDFYKEHSIQHRWVRLAESVEEIQQYNAVIQH